MYGVGSLMQKAGTDIQHIEKCNHNNTLKDHIATMNKYERNLEKALAKELNHLGRK